MSNSARHESIRGAPGQTATNGSITRHQPHGAAVDFTTPILDHARIRPGDAEKLEVIIGDLSGGRSEYIVPLHHLSKMVNLTVHDRTLCDEITNRNANSPDEIRRAVLTVAKLGLAGEKAAQAARQAIEVEQNERMLTTVYLVNLAIRQSDGNALNNPPLTTIEQISGSESRAMFRERLAKFAVLAGKSTDVIYSSLEEWAGIVGGVGIPGMPMECRLKRLAREIFELSSQLRGWADEEISYVGQIAREIAEESDRVGASAQQKIEEINRQLNGLIGAVTKWETTRQKLKSQMSELAWTLNGWEINISRWRECGKAPRDGQLNTIMSIYATVPRRTDIVESDTFYTDSDNRGRRQGSRKVKANQDWKTGAINYDIVQRIEAQKERIL